MFMHAIISFHIVNDNPMRFYHNFTNKSKSKSKSKHSRTPDCYVILPVVRDESGRRNSQHEYSQDI